MRSMYTSEGGPVGEWRVVRLRHFDFFSFSFFILFHSEVRSSLRFVRFMVRTASTLFDALPYGLHFWATGDIIVPFCSMQTSHTHIYLYVSSPIPSPLVVEHNHDILTSSRSM